LKNSGFVVELSADVDVGSGGVHSSSSNKTAFDKLMGVFAHDLTVLASARLTLICVDDEVTWLAVLFPALGVHK
jgi:hypothetical protein